MRNFFITLLFCFATAAASAQELQARVTIQAQKVSSQVDRRVFNTLQTSLTNFLNARRWTSDTWQPAERIKCNFLISIETAPGNNVYNATLTVQAARPVWGSTYESPLFSWQDPNFTFRYAEFGPIEFNENRIQGSDALAANLTATLAYYSHIILGLDYASYALRGGDPHFQKARNIVSNAPESREVSGWRAADGIRNRFRLVEGLVDNRFALMHDVLYAYYRTGMDQMLKDEAQARQGVLTALNYMSTINRENLNSMIVPVFFSGKGNELAQLFKKAPADVRRQAKDLLTKLDITNASSYRDL